MISRLFIAIFMLFTNYEVGFMSNYEVGLKSSTKVGLESNYEVGLESNYEIDEWHDDDDEYVWCHCK